MPPLSTLDHAALLVRDLDASVAWYRRVLGLIDPFPCQWDGVPVILVEPHSRTGLALFPASDDATTPDLEHSVAIEHVAFRVPLDTLGAWRDHLLDLGIEVESKDHGVCASLYFTDPDGHQLELTGYRAG